MTTEAKWYIVHAFSNFERKVAEYIRAEAATRGLAEQFEEVLVPTEKVVEVRRGRKIESERTFFPGYVLVKLKMSEAAYHLIKETPKVTGFLGADFGKKPTPVPEREVKRILGHMDQAGPAARPVITFEIGEKVKVMDGPFQSFEGLVEDVDDARSRLKVAVSIFGRATPVELEYSQVEKL